MTEYDIIEVYSIWMTELFCLFFIIANGSLFEECPAVTETT